MGLERKEIWVYNCHFTEHSNTFHMTLPVSLWSISSLKAWQ